MEAVMLALGYDVPDGEEPAAYSARASATNSKSAAAAKASSTPSRSRKQDSKAQKAASLQDRRKRDIGGSAKMKEDSIGIPSSSTNADVAGIGFDPEPDTRSETADAKVLSQTREQRQQQWKEISKTDQSDDLSSMSSVSMPQDHTRELLSGSKSSVIDVGTAAKELDSQDSSRSKLDAPQPSTKPKRSKPIPNPQQSGFPAIKEPEFVELPSAAQLLSYHESRRSQSNSESIISDGDAALAAALPSTNADVDAVSTLIQHADHNNRINAFLSTGIYKGGLTNEELSLAVQKLRDLHPELKPQFDHSARGKSPSSSSLPPSSSSSPSNSTIDSDVSSSPEPIKTAEQLLADEMLDALPSMRSPLEQSPRKLHWRGQSRADMQRQAHEHELEEKLQLWEARRDVFVRVKEWVRAQEMRFEELKGGGGDDATQGGQIGEKKVAIPFQV